jgi:hypothetical protein
MNVVKRPVRIIKQEQTKQKAKERLFFSLSLSLSREETALLIPFIHLFVHH